MTRSAGGIDKADAARSEPSRAEARRRRSKATPSAALSALFNELCPCGHTQGDHAAFKDRERGGWPCLEPGCDCLVDSEGRALTDDQADPAPVTNGPVLAPGVPCRLARPEASIPTYVVSTA